MIKDSSKNHTKGHRLWGNNFPLPWTNCIQGNFWTHFISSLFHPLTWKKTVLIELCVFRIMKENLRVGEFNQFQMCVSEIYSIYILFRVSIKIYNFVSNHPVETSVLRNASGVKKSKAWQTERRTDGQSNPYVVLCFASTIEKRKCWSHSEDITSLITWHQDLIQIGSVKIRKHSEEAFK